MAWALVQSSSMNQTGSNTASVISGLTAVTAGNALVMVHFAGSLTRPIVTVTGETWVDPGDFADPPGGGASLDLRYVLSAAGGETSFTVTYALETNWQALAFYEFSYTNTASLDAHGIRQPAGSETNPPGVTLTLGGTSDTIVQACAINTNPTAIDSGYTLIGPRFGLAAAYLLNTTSGTAPVWTAGAENPGDFYALAINAAAAGAPSQFVPVTRHIPTPVWRVG